MDLDQARAVACAALPRFGLPEESRITFVKYRENHVFRVDAPSGDAYALRLHRPGYRTDAEIDTELRYVRALRERGVPVADVLPAADGALLARVGAGRTLPARVVSVLRWLPDSRPSGDAGAAFVGHETPSPSDFARIGTLLAELHVAAQAIGVPPGFRRGAWDVDGLAGTRPLWGDPRRLLSLDDDARATLDGAITVLRGRLAAMDRDPAVFGVIHADATPENILETPSGLRLIDFDDFGTGWFVFDLVTALFHHTPQQQYPAFEHALRTAYEAVRPLTPVERGIWDALMLARGLTYLGWAADRPGDPAAEFVSAHVAPWTVRAADAFVAGAPMPWHAAAGQPSMTVPTREG